MGVAPGDIAELIRQLSETQHTLRVIHDEVADYGTPLATLHVLELEACGEDLDHVFERVHRLAKPLTELQEDSE